jgi:cytochrome c5
MYSKKLILISGALLLVLGACSSNQDQQPTTDKAVATAEPPAKGGAQLWAENCTRCHNARPPDYYSDSQWQILVQHMRLRANIDGAEARTIVQFLQASN